MLHFRLLVAGSLRSDATSTMPGASADCNWPLVQWTSGWRVRPLRRITALLRKQMARQLQRALEYAQQLGSDGARTERHDERIADVAGHTHGNAGESASRDVAEDRHLARKAIDPRE